ncbi:MAG: GFA family protein [Myxococcota bacterium]|nr:GFA family protein [Myxococcota bacterium]
MKTIQGSCHCRAVRFAVSTDLSRASRCNCNICQRTGATAVIVKPAQFELLAGKEALASYTRTPEIGRRFFCKTCGIHCYGAGHLEEIGGDFVSVNANCFDEVDPNGLPIVYWDGRHDNWGAGTRDRPWPLLATG